jgi:hypothetical protein
LRCIFGSVKITKIRYAIAYGLLADLAGVIASIRVAYLFFSHKKFTGISFISIPIPTSAQVIGLAKVVSNI